MKFNRYIRKDVKKLLEDQYNEYVKITPMSKKEMRALREWVKDGNSVYENPSYYFSHLDFPVEFLTVYRNEEYIRKHTKGMSHEDKKKFALEYYGLEDDEDRFEYIDCLIDLSDENDYDLPF